MCRILFLLRRVVCTMYPLAILAVLYVPSLIHAGNEKGIFLGNNAALTAGSHSANIRDAEAIYYNPAGLGGMVRSSIDLSGSAFMLRTERVKNYIVTQLPDLRLPLHLKENSFFSIPSVIAYGRDVTKKIGVGFGVFVPQFNTTTLQLTNTSSEGIFDYKEVLELHSSVVVYHVGPSLGWELRPNLRVGWTLFGVIDSAQYNTTYMIRASVRETGVSNYLLNTTYANINFAGFQIAFGLQWEVTHHLHLGLVQKSPTYTLYSWGKHSSLSSSNEQVQHDEKDISQWLLEYYQPMFTQIALAYQRPSFLLCFAFDFRPAMKNLRLQIERKAMWNASMGMKFAIKKDVYGGFGVFTDNHFYNQSEFLGHNQINYYGITLGGDWSKLFQFTKGSYYKSLRIITTAALRYAIGLGKYGGRSYIVESETASVRYVEAMVHEISLHIGSSFGF